MWHINDTRVTDMVFMMAEAFGMALVMAGDSGVGGHHAEKLWTGGHLVK